MIRKFILKFLVPLFILLAVILWFLDTTAGLKTVFWIVQKTIPGQLTAGEIQGAIFREIEITDIHYQYQPSGIPGAASDKFGEFQGRKLSLKIDMQALLYNTVHIPYFKLEDGLINFRKTNSSQNTKILIDTLKGNATLETPYRSEIINIEEMTGSFQNEAFQGKLHLFVYDTSMEDFRAEFTLGNSHLRIEPQSNRDDKPNLKASLPDQTQENKQDKENTTNYVWNVQYHPNDAFDFNANGTIDLANLKDINGKIQNAKLYGTTVDTWTLSNPAAFSIQAHNFKLDSFKLEPLRFENAKKSAILIQTAWDKSSGGTLQIDMPDFALQLPQIRTKLSLHLVLQQDKDKLITGTGELIVSPGHAKISLPGKKFYQSAFQGGTFSFNLSESGLHSDFQFRETLRNTLNAHLEVQDFSFDKPFSNQKISGDFNGKFQDLSIVYLLVPPISRLNTVLSIEGTFGGTLAKPTVTLNANIPNAIFSIPKQHITIKSFSANLNGEIPGQLKLDATGTLGGNLFFIKGAFEPFKKDGENYFDFTGDKIRVSNTTNSMILASPKLHFQIIDSDLFVTGSINIPEANIIMKEGLHQVIISKDVVFHEPGRDQDAVELNLIPMVEVKIEDGENVHFKGFGLDATMRGNIAIEKRPDGFFTGTGRLTIIEGKYRLQGSEYHIHRGHLLYPPGTLLNDPVLDIRIAKKQANQVGEGQEVGIYVQGTLQNPNFSLYSSDEMQSTEILSRLGFGGGHVEGEDNQNQKKQLLSQTAMYIAGGANPLIENLQSKLGLEEFGVQSAESQRVFTSFSGYDTVLVAGKSLSKRFYLQFIQGMLEPLSMVRLKYFLSPKFVFSVETSNAEDIGGDISFSMESN